MSSEPTIEVFAAESGESSVSLVASLQTTRKTGIFLKPGLRFLGTTFPGWPEKLVPNAIELLKAICSADTDFEPWDIPETQQDWHCMPEAVELFKETHRIMHGIAYWAVCKEGNEDEMPHELMAEIQQAIKPLSRRLSIRPLGSGQLVFANRWFHKGLSKYRESFDNPGKYTRIMIHNRVAQAIIIAFTLEVCQPVAFSGNAQPVCPISSFLSYCMGCGHFFLVTPGSDRFYDSNACKKDHQRRIKLHEENLAHQASLLSR